MPATTTHVLLVQFSMISSIPTDIFCFLHLMHLHTTLNELSLQYRVPLNLVTLLKPTAICVNKAITHSILFATQIGFQGATWQVGYSAGRTHRLPLKLQPYC